MILRIRNLKTKLPEEQVVAEITSYNFLHRIRNLLSTTDYMDLSKDLIKNNLDTRVAAGDKALELSLSRIRKTIALLEPMVEKLKTKLKAKSVHTVGSMDELDLNTSAPKSPSFIGFYRITLEGRWQVKLLQKPGLGSRSQLFDPLEPEPV